VEQFVNVSYEVLVHLKVGNEICQY